MSVICQNFVHNAWRKDLCSNCFKSEADHSKLGSGNSGDSISAQRYVSQATSIYQSRGLSMNWRPIRTAESAPRISCRDFGSQTTVANAKISSDEPRRFSCDVAKGILKDFTPDRKARRSSSVGFASDEPLVIGYGGRDYDSDDSPWEMGSDDGSINLDLLDFTDEDRNISKLTKNNTEYNSVNENLITKQQTISSGNSLDSRKEDNIETASQKRESSCYYSAKSESLNSNPSVFSNQDNILNNCKEMSLIAKDIPGIINNIESKSNSQPLDNVNQIEKNHDVMKTEENDSQRSPTRYLLITKVQDSCGSDSDYSTYKQTNGESSTDSESFPDADDSHMVPCTSFLHGSSVAKTQNQSRNYHNKPFETSSVSSTDTAFSDDSDSQKHQETSISKTRVNVNKSPARKAFEQRSISVDKPLNVQPVVEVQEIPSSYSLSCDKRLSVSTLEIGHVSNDIMTKEKNKRNEMECQKESSKTETDNKPTRRSHARPNSIHEMEYSKSYLHFSSPLAKAESELIVSNNSTMSVRQVSVSTEHMPNSERSKNSVKSNSTIISSSERNPRTENRELDKNVTKTNCNSSKFYDVNEQRESSKRVSNDSTSFEKSEEERRPNGEYKQNSSSNSSSGGSSPTYKTNRDSKLAALALELEKERCENNLKLRSLAQTPPRTKSTKQVLTKTYSDTPKTHEPKYPSVKRGKSLTSASQVSKSSMPDLLPADMTSKPKKSRFSLKKLLKRGKDSDTLVISGSNEYNPKAWKKQSFDRSRLSLEIVHPMDMVDSSLTSTDSTPTDQQRKFPCGNTRARSLSSLPHLETSSNGEPEITGLRRYDAATLDRSAVDIPRKAGTVAERSKKYKAPRRTPSFSEVTCSSPTSRPISGGVSPAERPPKPPPPPRGKTLTPPQPPSVPPPQGKHKNQMSGPSRPPPPNIQEVNEDGTPTSNKKTVHVIGEYANLGDIRLNITPKKPQRPSAVTFARDIVTTDERRNSQQMNNSEVQHRGTENAYETLEAPEEEDHYTYLDETEVKKEDPNSTKISTKTTSEGRRSPNNSVPNTSGSTTVLKKPWMNLHASYAAIAAANYESLAELITTAISEGLEEFKKLAPTLKWTDFELEPEDPIQTLEDKIVYNAVHKTQAKTKVTLVVTTQKQHTTQNNRNPTRLPVLATFNDSIPKQYVAGKQAYLNSQPVMIYVLQRSKTTTVNQFAKDSACFQTNQHIHLRNACFVLLQLIHTLKSLQAEGIEEIDYDLSRILLLHTDVDKPPILVLLPGDKVYLTMTDFYKADVATRRTTLCTTVLQLLYHLLQIKDAKDLSVCVVNGEALAAPVAHTFSIISKILMEEKASSLTQAKGLLEYMLWGPVDIKTTGTEEDIDVILQRWLDLQRAQMVKSLVSNLHLKISSHTGFHIYEEYQLIFLLQATVKCLKDIILKL